MQFLFKNVHKIFRHRFSSWLKLKMSYILKINNCKGFFLVFNASNFCNYFQCAEPKPEFLFQCTESNSECRKNWAQTWKSGTCD